MLGPEYTHDYLNIKGNKIAQTSGNQEILSNIPGDPSPEKLIFEVAICK